VLVRLFSVVADHGAVQRGRVGRHQLRGDGVVEKVVDVAPLVRLIGE